LLRFQRNYFGVERNKSTEAGLLLCYGIDLKLLGLDPRNFAGGFAEQRNKGQAVKVKSLDGGVRRQSKVERGNG
jgi:hypothetical protein